MEWSLGIPKNKKGANTDQCFYYIVFCEGNNKMIDICGYTYTDALWLMMESCPNKLSLSWK